ncbi:MAG: two-component response regulator [Candidatus Scalindua rubra]|uniref:diguanylate cyclase n=1 Tax=Candidatus Scalindua rubra TaxID=1872076 RepID=A0A1E3X5H6_9BACT|nr:MAG: two-component response regulator [Candidatus Scalindua rubra]
MIGNLFSDQKLKGDKMANQDDREITRESDSGEVRIMVVDDEESILKTVNVFLAKSGYKVTTFLDAQNAIEALKKDVYDTVITDLKMPGFTGVEFVKKAKQVSPNSDFIVMTGFPSVESAVACMKLGATDYIAKPLDMEYLKIVVERTLYKRALERRAAERDYYEQISRLDGLTGVYNRRFLHELLDFEIARCDRYKHSFSLLMIDIDDFKKINDKYGHPTGDEVLKKLASTFKSLIRKTDLVVRYGGEEFAIILSETSKEHGIIFGDRIVNGVATLKVKGIPRDDTLTISAGLVSYPDNARTQETLIKRADEALYKAKGMGKNTLCVYGT